MSSRFKLPGIFFFLFKGIICSVTSSLKHCNVFTILNLCKKMMFLLRDLQTRNFCKMHCTYLCFGCQFVHNFNYESFIEHNGNLQGLFSLLPFVVVVCVSADFSFVGSASWEELVRALMVKQSLRFIRVKHVCMLKPHLFRSFRTRHEVRSMVQPNLHNWAVLIKCHVHAWVYIT